MIRLLVVDDSALMRRHLREIFEQIGGFDVAVARNGEDALEQLAQFQPDVVTLDIHMPVMDGLTCLSRIMAERPTPTVMISSLTEEGALATFEALALGAVDYIPKPGGTVSLNIRDARREIVTKVRAAAAVQMLRPSGCPLPLPPPSPPSPPSPPTAVSATGEGIVLIGVSTGGPRALEFILPALPGDFPWPVVIAQHMPRHFTQVFADRLDSCCALTVREVGAPLALESGSIYIGQGDADLVVTRRGSRLMAMSVPLSNAHRWHPSVDRLVASVLEHMEPERILGVLLTGMGSDGAEAMAELHRRGGRTIAESEDSAVVFGMPRELVRLGGASTVLPLERVTGQITRWMQEVA